MSREQGAQKKTEEHTNHHLVVLKENGHKPRTVIRSQHFGAQDTSINMGEDTGAYMILAYLMLSETSKNFHEYFFNKFTKASPRHLLMDIWMLVCSFAFPPMPHFNKICRTEYLIKPSLFSLAACDSAEVIHAVFDADEATVCRMLSAISIPTQEDPTGLNKLRTILCTTELKTGITPLQAALRTGDIAMALALKPYFDQLPDGPQEMADQIKAVFPKGLEDFRTCQREEAVDLLKKSGIEAAMDETPNTTDGIQNALNSFKEKLSAYLKTHPIHNPYILLKAFEMCERNCTYNRWSSVQASLFSIQVVGWIQENSSNALKQGYANGIYPSTTVDKGEAKRSFHLRGTSVDIRTVSGLGSSSCINISGEAAEFCSRGGSWVIGSEYFSFWRRHLQTNHDKLGDLWRQLSASQRTVVKQ